MDLIEYIKGLNRRSKFDDMPGTVEKFLDEPCPNCGKGLKKMHPCCGDPPGSIQCVAKCGYYVSV